MKHLLLFSTAFFCLNIFAQSDTEVDSTAFEKPKFKIDYTKVYGISLGANYAEYLFAEVGFYKSHVFKTGKYPQFSALANYACEISMADKLVLGPKIQTRLHIGYFCPSITTVLYTDLQKGYALKFRPEIGFGMWFFDVSYGYNFNIAKSGLDQYNRHVLSLHTYLGLKKVKKTKYSSEF